MTELCEIAFKYGTDKCPQLGHSYTPFYYELLKDKRETFKKVLELGVGSQELMFWTPEHYQTGAGLLMWRDFFPKAQIYGVDIGQSAIFQAERISTFLLDTKSQLDMSKLVGNIGSDIDLVIDDGNHNGRAQIHAVRNLMPLLKRDCLYIIEDAKRPLAIRDKLSREYDCEAFEFNRRHKQRHDALIVVKHK